MKKFQWALVTIVMFIATVPVDAYDKRDVVGTTAASTVEGVADGEAMVAQPECVLEQKIIRMPSRIIDSGNPGFLSIDEARQKVLVLGGVSIGIITSCALVTLLLTRKKKRSTTGVSNDEEYVPPAINELMVMVENTHVVSDETGRTDADYVDAVEADGVEQSALSLARGLGRTRGEMQMALTIHPGNQNRSRSRTFRRLIPTSTSDRDRIRIAKELGIARGELDLELSLRKFSERKKEKEAIA